MKNLRISLLIFILIFHILPLFSQENEEPVSATLHSLGDQTFSFNAGLFIPLFFSDKSFRIEGTSGHLSLGGAGALEWNSYLNGNMLLGAQLSGMFALTPNKRTLSMIPITVKYSYIFDLFPFTIPVSIAAGFSFNSLDDLFEFTPILKPGASVYYSINNEWGLGLNLNYWWVPEFHSGDLADQTRFGNFLDIAFTAIYHF